MRRVRCTARLEGAPRACRESFILCLSRTTLLRCAQLNSSVSITDKERNGVTCAMQPVVSCIPCFPDCPDPQAALLPAARFLDVQCDIFPTKSSTVSIDSGAMQRPAHVSNPIPVDLPYDVLFVGSAAVVDFDPIRYGRVPHPDAAKEAAAIDGTWAAAVAARPATYNATKFRLAGVLATPTDRNSGSDDGATGAVAATVTLQLGLTDYRTYVGTHLGSGDSPMAFWGDPRHLALALGNAAVVVTSDGRVPLLRRSAAVVEGSGHYAVPGGHPEPSALTGADGDGRAFPADPAAAAAAVSAELTASMAREIVEELYLSPDAVPLDCLVLLGGVARGGGCGRPQLCYRAALKLSSGAVEAAWAAGVRCHTATAAVAAGDRHSMGAAAEAVESTELVWLDEAEIGVVVSTGRTRDGKKLMPEHWGAVALYWGSCRGEDDREEKSCRMTGAEEGGSGRE